VAESCMGGELGARVSLGSAFAPSAVMFSEEPSRVVVSCARDQVAALMALAQQHGAPVTELGTVGGDRLVLEGLCDVSLADMSAAFEGAIPKIVGE